MLRITPKQMEHFESDFRLRRRLRYVSALRACGWIDQTMSDAAALQRVDAAVADAKSVGMSDENDLVRFAALAFIPELVRHDPPFSNRLGHILTNLGAAPSARLDFAYRALRLERFGVIPLPFPPYRHAQSGAYEKRPA